MTLIEVNFKIKDLDPKKSSNKALANEWRWTLANYVLTKKGMNSGFTLDEIEGIALKILREIIFRVKEGKMQHKFEPEKMTPSSREVYQHLLKKLSSSEKFCPCCRTCEEKMEASKYAPIVPSGISRGDEIHLEDILPYFQSFKIRKPYIYLTGGIVNNGHTNGDIDILIKEKEKNPPIEFRIFRMFPPELRERIHFLYDDGNFGPFTKFIPLYDMEIAVQDKAEVEEMESVLLERDPDDIQLKRYPLFSYLGSKAVLIDEILKTIPTDVKSIVDPFAGSCPLMWELKRRRFEVSTNDISYWSYNIQYALLKNPRYKLSDAEIKDLVETSSIVKDKVFFHHHFSPSTKNYLNGVVMKAHKMKCPYRKAIALAAVGKMASKIFFAFHERLTYLQNLQNFRKEFEDSIRYIQAFVVNGSATVKRGDAIEFMKHANGDLIYLDPPYAFSTEGHDHDDQYGRWLGGIDRILLQTDKRVTDYDVKKKDEEKFIENMIKAASRFKYIMMSYYPNRSFGEERLRTLLKKYKKHVMVKRPAGRWTARVRQKSMRGTTHIKEILILASNEDLDKKAYFEFSESPNKDADKSRAEDKIVPFRFFTQVKAIAGYRKQETYSLEGLIETIQTLKDFFPCEVDEKYDGARHQIHKVGDRIQIWSEDGGDSTDRFPFMVNECKKMKPNFIIDAEITGWDSGKYKEGKHIGRSDVAGYIHEKSPPNDKFYFANSFDCLWFEGEDLHKKPLSERREALKKVGDTEHIKIIDKQDAKNIEELKTSVEYFRDPKNRPGTEGAMIKSLASDYPLTGMIQKWIKFKNEVDLDAEIVSIHRVEGTDAFNYLCAIEDLSGKRVPVGRTYNTNIKAQIGDIIRVAFVNLDKYTDSKTGQIWFNWWAPRVIEKREDKDKPDNTVFAEGLVNQTKGIVGVKSFPIRYKGLLTIFEHFIDPFLIHPDENKKWKFVLTAHIRGRSVHLDLRRQISDTLLIGPTLFIPKGLPRDPKNFEDAKALFNEHILPLVKKTLEDPNTKFLSSRKAPEPIEWLDVEGEIKPGQVGATKYEYGYFIKLDFGEVEFGTLKPYFVECFYHGQKKLLEQKYVERLIENQKNWRKTTEGLLAWMFFKAENQPYILTERSIETKYNPSVGISALPLNVREKVPKEFQYWKNADSAQRLIIRDNLIKELKKKKIVLEGEAKFRLMHRWWRGPIVVRAGPSKEFFDLLIDKGDGKIIHYELLNDPSLGDSVGGAISNPLDKKMMEVSGELEPGTVLNPDKKDIPANWNELDSGKMNIIEWTNMFQKVKFDGKRLSGLFIIKKEIPDSKIITVERSSLPQPEMKHTISMSFDIELNNFRVLPQKPNEPYLDIEGTLLLPKQIKNIYFNVQNLKDSILRPKIGENLCYVDLFHLRNKMERVGILKEIWWDPNQEWTDVVTREKFKGAERFKATITDSYAIEKMIKTPDEFKRVSAEVEMDQIPTPIHVLITGAGITDNPACRECIIETAIGKKHYEIQNCT